ncbi:MAG: hypothetical protein IJB91_04500 [Oscillospiraceae bacterium]|nr:hypothetical protein [Oscillospiraceae bacterium]
MLNRLPQHPNMGAAVVCWLKNTTSCVVVPKSFSYAQSRRSGLPPSDEGGGTA